MMNKFRFLSQLVLVLLTLAILDTPALAQATRTWVSSTPGLGDDANPCSRSAPCKTFAGAISKTAAGGEIDVLDPGGYGAVTITKSLTIDGGGGQVASVLASGSPGITVSGAGIFVRLRNLTLNGSLSGTIGVRVANAGRVSIEHCNIQGFTTYGIGFLSTGAGSRLFVSNSLVHDNAGYGIAASPTASGAAGLVTLENDEIFHNGVGMFVGDNANVAATRTQISNNTSLGINVTTSTALALVNLDASSVSANGGNGISMSLTGGHPFVRVSNSQIVQNTGASFVIPVGADVVSYQNNVIADNGTDTLANNTGMLH